MSDSYISLDNLVIEYGSTVVVPGLSLNIKRGELIALLGPSGCGKSTTMRAIAGLLSPKSGRIIVDGIDVTNMPANKRGIGLVFQSYALFPHLNAFENVAFGLRLRKLPTPEINERVDAGLQTVGLLELAKRKPARMSGGQQQRLALARSLVLEPKVLLLDEPLSNLDARLRLEMRNELQRVQRETGITMIFVTHDQSEALALADRIVLMKDGAIEQIGTPDDLYNRPTSVFGADFFGFENIFEVKNSVIHTAHGSVTLPFPVPNGPIAWRPIGVEVGKGSLEGSISAVAFAGEQIEYVIDSSLGTIVASAPANSRRHSIGDNVQFNLPEHTALSVV